MDAYFYNKTFDGRVCNKYLLFFYIEFHHLIYLLFSKKPYFFMNCTFQNFKFSGFDAKFYLYKYIEAETMNNIVLTLERGGKISFPSK